MSSPSSPAASSSAQAAPSPLRICLARCSAPEQAAEVLPGLLESAGLWEDRSLAGLHVLVKPNLLRNVPLACTSPEVVAGVCRWLLDRGARVRVADSPGFGSARGVARAIGLDRALADLGLQVEPMGRGCPVRLRTGDEILISRTALESDAIVSVARVKAHSQMRLTLTCKNCYGCVPGLHKALYHTRQGNDPERFAAMQAAILQALPSVAGVVDGIVAMHVTGPARGRPYALGLLGACTSPVALDEAVCHVLGRNPLDVPLQRALLQAGHPDCEALGRPRCHPLLAPEDFAVADFVLPDRLLHTTFSPLRLLRSCCKRLWEELVH